MQPAGRCPVHIKHGLETVDKQKLDGQGRARREAARRRKSECKINLGPK